MSDDPGKPAARFAALNVPPPALEHGGDEVLRAVIAEGQLQAMLAAEIDRPTDIGAASAVS